MQRAEIREVRMNPNLTEDQRLAIETCPGYNETLTRALEPRNYYEWNRCRDCRLRVTASPLVDRVTVDGQCPKL